MRYWILSIVLWPALVLAESDTTAPLPPKLPSDIVGPSALGPSHQCMTFYPPAALRAHASGAVTMSFTIGTDGTVRAVAVTKSSGNSALDSAAIKCVSSWLYKPASRDGQPVEVPWSVTVSFNIGNSFPPPGMTLAPKRLDSNDCPHDSISKLPEESTEVSFTVGADGSVKNVSVTKSSGDTALDQIGVDCVTKWQFSPASRDGQPVEVKGSTKFDWKN